LILTEWKLLPNSFASMKKLAIALITMFGSTYVCEQLFSLMNSIKSTVRSHLGIDLSVQLKSTNYNPRFDFAVFYSQMNLLTNSNKLLIKNSCMKNTNFFFYQFKICLTYLCIIDYTFNIYMFNIFQLFYNVMYELNYSSHRYQNFLGLTNKKKKKSYNVYVFEIQT